MVFNSSDTFDSVINELSILILQNWDELLQLWGSKVLGEE